MQDIVGGPKSDKSRELMSRNTQWSASNSCCSTRSCKHVETKVPSTRTSKAIWKPKHGWRRTWVTHSRPTVDPWPSAWKRSGSVLSSPDASNTSLHAEHWQVVEINKTGAQEMVRNWFALPCSSLSTVPITEAICRLPLFSLQGSRNLYTTLLWRIRTHTHTHKGKNSRWRSGRIDSTHSTPRYFWTWVIASFFLKRKRNGA
jgi:hypothetical protein